MKLLVLANPRARGGRTFRLMSRIQQWLNLLPHDIVVEVPASREDTVRVAREARKRGFKGLVSLGGDGTARDVFEGALDSDLPVAVLPGGRGNDIVRHLGFSWNMRTAISQLADLTTSEIDIPTLQGKVFQNVAGVGFDAKVVEYIVLGGCKVGGTLCYLFDVLRTILTFRPLRLKVTVDGRSFEDEYMMVAVANGPHYGGGMLVAPQARLGDGQLDICMVRKLSIPRFLMVFPKVYRGTHVNLPEITMLRGKEIIIEGDPTMAAADGDLYGALPARFHVGKHRLKVLIPRNGSTRI